MHLLNDLLGGGGALLGKPRTRPWRYGGRVTLSW
jgi:hypothetical protein